MTLAARRSIISWDIGLKHLAFSVISLDMAGDWRLERFGNIDLSRAGQPGSPAFCGKFAEVCRQQRVFLPEICAVYIEKQPYFGRGRGKCGNVVMQKISAILVSFYVFRGMNPDRISLVDSREKFEVLSYQGHAYKGRRNYAKRKEFAVNLAMDLLNGAAILGPFLPCSQESLGKNQEKSRQIAVLPKKDDVCDSLLIGLVFIREYHAILKSKRDTSL